MVGTILAIVLLAAAVTGTAIGLSPRTGDNSEKVVVSQEGAENSAANDADTSETASDSPQASPSLKEAAAFVRGFIYQK